MKFFIAVNALFFAGFANSMPLGNKTDPSAKNHHLLHHLENGGKGGHKVHIDRQQNFEIINDGKDKMKYTYVGIQCLVYRLLNAVLLS